MSGLQQSNWNNSDKVKELAATNSSQVNRALNLVY